MKYFLLTACCFLCLPTHAQTAPFLMRRSRIEDVLRIIVDPFSIPHKTDLFKIRKDLNRDISSQYITPGRALNAYLQSTLAAQLHFVPDWFKTYADGENDAPSIGRADAAACAAGTGKVEFIGRHYLLASAVPSFPCTLHWEGRIWQEEMTTTQAAMAGTWLDIGSSFAGSVTSPVTLSGVAASGSRIEYFGLAEPGQTAAPSPTHDASGNISGYSPSTWAPVAYPPVVRVDDVNGAISIEHIMLYGVYDGLNAHLSGRTSFNDIRGQVFHHGITTDKSYDASKSDDWHFWPFWSAADPVISYQQAHMVAWLAGRNDTAMIGRVFTFGSYAGVEIEGTASESSLIGGGTVTGMSMDQLQCDFTRHCLLVDATASGASFQIGAIRSYGQKWDSIIGSPVGMLAGSNVIQMDGFAVGQIGSIVSFGADGNIFKFTNTTNPSNIQVGSLYGVLTRMSVNSNIVSWPTTESKASLLTLAAPPMLTPDAPRGFTNTNYAAGGVGTLQWPTAQPIH